MMIALKSCLGLGIIHLSNLNMFIHFTSDPGGYQWPPTIPLAQNSYFRLAVFLAVFWVPNFWGRFEALNDVFLGIAWTRSSLALLIHHSTPRRDLSNGLLNDPNGDHMQKLCPQEVGLQIYHFGVNKIVGVSSSRVVFRVFLLPCFMLKGFLASL